MSSEQIGGLIRTVVALLGGYAAGHGIFDAGVWDAVGTGVVGIAVAIWSFYSKKPKA